MVETKKMSGREKLLRYLDNKKKEEEAAEKRYAEKERERKEKILYKDHEVKEATLSGAGFPAAADSAGGQAIDKFPTGCPKKKKKKKRLMARRPRPKL